LADGATGIDSSVLQTINPNKTLITIGYQDGTMVALDGQQKNGNTPAKEKTNAGQTLDEQKCYYHR
jgi:hypothetical protein